MNIGKFYLEIVFFLRTYHFHYMHVFFVGVDDVQENYIFKKEARFSGAGMNGDVQGGSNISSRGIRKTRTTAPA